MAHGIEYLEGPHKRRLDVLGGLALAGILSPAIVATGIACAIDARTLNPLFIQERSTGERGTVETYKFQTLTKEIGGIAVDQVLGTFDPRSSRLGQKIRQLGLDESPQLVNVLKGDMSLVGPRPLLQSEIERFEDADSLLFADWYPQYSLTKPGITGQSQIMRHHYRGLSDGLRTQSMRLDLEYFESASLATDVALIARTPARILDANIAVEEAAVSAS